ncbi:MAG: hypothetical protein Q9162_000354 [Coniocarpon cinnabarinum]
MPDVTSLQPLEGRQLVLDEETIFDILGAARSGSVEELKDLCSTLSDKHHATYSEILRKACNPENGNTAAHYAAANGWVQVLNLVKEIEADERLAVDGSASDSETSPGSLFNQVNGHGSTALHYAAVDGQVDCVEALLSHPIWANDRARRKAYAEIKNSAGLTARDDADSQGAAEEDWLRVDAILEACEI